MALQISNCGKSNASGSLLLTVRFVERATERNQVIAADAFCASSAASFAIRSHPFLKNKNINRVSSFVRRKIQQSAPLPAQFSGG
jgi:hypothetical protein